MGIISLFKREQLIKIIKTKLGEEVKAEWKPTDEYIKNLTTVPTFIKVRGHNIKKML